PTSVVRSATRPVPLSYEYRLTPITETITELLPAPRKQCRGSLRCAPQLAASRPQMRNPTAVRVAVPTPELHTKSH
ncbi:hypothetical protein ACWD01_19755, partial [Streptomyces sp. NPDC002835]